MAAQRLNGVAEPASTEAQVQADAKRYTELEQRRLWQGIGHRAGDRLDPVEHRQCDDGRRDARRDDAIPANTATPTPVINVACSRRPTTTRPGLLSRGTTRAASRSARTSKVMLAAAYTKTGHIVKAIRRQPSQSTPLTTLRL